MNVHSSLLPLQLFLTPGAVLGELTQLFWSVPSGAVNQNVQSIEHLLSCSLCCEEPRCMAFTKKFMYESGVKAF